MHAPTIDTEPQPHALDNAHVLDSEECTKLRQQIFDLREHWVQRHPQVPFYTLGTASYLDANGGQYASYLTKKEATNPILIDHFTWFYDRVLERASALLNAPACYDDRLARPGFHVYLANPAFGQPVAKIHCDLQYQSIDWTGFDVAKGDDEEHISFTISIRLPACGGGLNYWDVDHQQAKDDPNAAKQKFDKDKPLFHPYEQGSMVIHSGKMIHQASIMKDVQPTDERITMQGHGIRMKDGWLLYW
ncbi:MAG: hypothetical protein ACI9R3_001980 [Verrucomicrobiales bacterium]|jgi:hypothetical protein